MTDTTTRTDTRPRPRRGRRPPRTPRVVLRFPPDRRGISYKG